MIDTVIFRIHDLFSNQQLLERLENKISGKAQMIKVGEEKEDINREVFLKRYYIDFATGNSYAEGYKGFVRSSHYDIAFYVNHPRDYIEFNISLPKYYHGNNLAQLVDHIYDKDFLLYKRNNFWELPAHHFEWFNIVMNRFLWGEIDYKGPRRNVEIVRIDLCFNLVFNMKEDAFFYLSELRNIRRKRFSENSNAITNYHSGVYFPSKDYTVKIYHKGTEFKKNNYNKVRKRLGKQTADEILRLSNTILRYEVEFRAGAMTDYFLTSLKEENPYVYNCVNLSRQFSANSFVTIDGIKHNVDGVPPKSTTGPFKKLTSGMSLDIKRGDFLRKRNFKFWLEKDSEESLLNLSPTRILEYRYHEKFDLRLFRILLMKFKETFHHFQVGNFESIELYNYAIKMNKEDILKKQISTMTGIPISNGISEGKIKIIVDLLYDHSWDQIKEKGILSKTAFYRYKKFFKNLGLKERNSTYHYNIDFTYSNYYDLLFNARAPIVSNRLKS